MYTKLLKLYFFRLPIVLIVVSLYSGLAIAAGTEQILNPNKTPLSTGERLKLGERMYREGKLPSGETMKASIKGDIRVDSTAFSCVSCHMRGGLGSIEGGVATPPATGNKLFQPYISGTILTSSPRLPRTQNIVNPVHRPAYTRDTLADALRGGMNPAGRKLNDVMPRYHLKDDEMAILIDYLSALSADISPGVDSTTIRLATIISEDVKPEDRKAMLEPLENFVAAKNNQAKLYATRARYMRGGGFPEEINLAYRTLTLARWTLKGHRDTWQNQLKELNRKEPVFAFIGGITTGDWKPIHEFCEAERIPCLFPVTDFPVISDTDWYTVYYSKGLYQEGEAAAGFLDRVNGFAQESGVIQIVSNSLESRTLSAGFMEKWRDLSKKPPITIEIKDNEPVSSDALLQLISTYKPAAVLLWAGPEMLSALKSVSNNPLTPKYLFLSSGYLKKEIWKVPESAREITYITYPYRLPQETNRTAQEIAPFTGNSQLPLKHAPEQNNEQRIATRVQDITEILQLGLMDMNLNFYRETFLDVISMIPDQKTQDYERLSFGPGQRYASKGCNIVQLSEGASPVLVKRSDWVIH
jgi:hypothetical protein